MNGKYNKQISGVCARSVAFEIKDGLVTHIEFSGGCNGFSKAVSRLCENKPVNDIVALLSGIECGKRKTSCADQLANALKESNNETSTNN